MRQKFIYNKNGEFTNLKINNNCFMKALYHEDASSYCFNLNLNFMEKCYYFVIVVVVVVIVVVVAVAAQQ
jgi:hypothetical protein